MNERIYVEGFTCSQCGKVAPCYQGAVRETDGKWFPLYFCELCNHHLDGGDLTAEDCGCINCAACIALGCEEAWK